MRPRIKIWLTAVRPFAYSASVVPVVLGTVLAYLDGAFDLLLFAVALLSSVLLHTGTNLVNDSFDFVKGVGIKTISTVLGFKHAKWEYLLLVLGAFFVILILVFSGLASPLLLCAFLAFPTAYRIMRHVIRTQQDKAYELATVDVRSAQLPLQMGGLMIIGLIVSVLLE